MVNYDHLREKVAREICSFSNGKCCDSEAAPCRVGRGEIYNGGNCGATLDLLGAWGHLDEADRVLSVTLEHGKRSYRADRG